MKIEINIDNYISDDEKHDIAVEAFREAVVNATKTPNEVERFVSNIAYNIVHDLVNKQINGDLETKIVAKVEEVINDLSSYSVFNKADKYLREEDSVGQKLLEQACKDNEKIIYKKVQELFLDIKEHTLYYFLDEAVTSALHNVFKNKETK